MADDLRVVLDTNVILAAKRSSNEERPNAEILDRWQRREFAVLYTLDTLAEYAEKLLQHNIPEDEVESFIRSLARHAEQISVVFFHFRHYPVDADDVMFLLCAANGDASHLVSYDQHLLSLRPYYHQEFIICRTQEFLTACRNRG